MIRFYQHIEEVKNERTLLKAAVEVDKKLPVEKSWHGSLQKIVCLFGGELNKESKYDRLIIRVVSSFKTKYIEWWEKALKSKNKNEPNSGKLYLYRKIKTAFQMEPYLSLCKKRKYRQSLTALRISAHRLEIETDRYAKEGEFIKREERFCKLCERDGIKVVGDEEHAMLICPVFDKQRQKTMVALSSLFPNFSALSNSNKLIFMLTCEGEGATQVSKLAHSVLIAPRYNRSVKGQSRKKKDKRNG